MRIAQVAAMYGAGAVAYALHALHNGGAARVRDYDGAEPGDTVLTRVVLSAGVVVVIALEAAAWPLAIVRGAWRVRRAHASNSHDGA